VPVAASTQLIGGGTYQTPDWLVDVELFTKDLSHLTQLAPRIATTDGQVDFDDFFFHGDGTVRGGELLIQKRSGRHTAG
jgi:ferric enterobactin receptor